MSKHTPGPWVVAGKIGDHSSTVARIGNDVNVLGISGDFVYQREVAYNANLIAAAPDLLEALILARQTIEERCESRGHGCVYSARETMPNVFKVIDGAIAKARGEE